MKEIAAKNVERGGPSEASGRRDGPGRVAAPVVPAVGSCPVGAGLPFSKIAKNAPVLARMAAQSTQYPRFGYRRIRIFLEPDGHIMR